MWSTFQQMGLRALLVLMACGGAPGLAAPPFIGAPDPAKPATKEPLTPEQEKAAFLLPPGFEIELVAAESDGIGKFVTVDWDLQGRMWSMTALEYPVDANESPEVAKALYASRAKDKVLVWDKPYGSGPNAPRVFAEGLAIPLGILPYKNGVYAQHGPDIVFLSDTNGDGKADKREVILSGFGVQDSHLFPHQFTRGPGNWMWFAQGAFNFGKVRTTKGAEQQFDRTRMARFRYDGSDFDITSQGPCNIWGLALTPEGECFIQEANDYGYPVMPFHAYANYPGCSDALFKSYAPEFPGTADFRMGGTGLSGLALSDTQGAWPAPYADVMYVANPITRKIQAIKLHRDGPRYRLEKLPDFVQSSDEMFRPVALRTGPDGCMYIVDWYNKIISHNEVPRNHPERDKKRGRIWRVKHKAQQPFEVPNFLALPAEAVLSKLGSDSASQSHMAWQAIADRQLTEAPPRLKEIIADASQSAGRRIAALWSLEGLRQVDVSTVKPLLADTNRNARREAVRALGEAVRDETGTVTTTHDVIATIATLATDPDPEVRAEVLRSAGPLAGRDRAALELCVKMAQPSLAEPTAKSTHNGRTIKVREAYEREFERYLARLFLEQHPVKVAEFVDTILSEASQNRFELESLLVACLALEPKESAARVAQLLPRLTRVPNDEEVLRIASFPDQPGVRDALMTLLSRPGTSTSTLEALVRSRVRLDAEKLTPMLADAARNLWMKGAESRPLALRLASSFKIHALEKTIHDALSEPAPPGELVTLLRALRELGGNHVDAVAPLLRNPARQVADEAAQTLAASRNPAGPAQLVKEWGQISLSQRRAALSLLPATRAGASVLVDAANSGSVPQADLDEATLDRLQAVLGDDPALVKLTSQMDVLFRSALRLDGNNDAYLDANIVLEGPFTVETWVKLDEGISNEDGILGAPGSADFNFAGGVFRVWCGAGLGDRVIASKKTPPNTWTHIAVTRDPKGVFRLYLNGELDNTDVRAVTNTFGNLDVGRTIPARGTSGWLSEFRVWKVTRSSDEIRRNHDRSFEGEVKPRELAHYFGGEQGWGRVRGTAKSARTSDFPPLLTAAEARAQEEVFSRFRTIAHETGDATRGKTLFGTVCSSCHAVDGQGGQVGPVLGGAGATGTEALLRNILTPNAAMEAGYRIFRVELNDGDVLDGILVSQDENAIVLRRPNVEDTRIKQEDVRRARFVRRSMMPDGLLEGLKPQEVADLFAYLHTLK